MCNGVVDVRNENLFLRVTMSRQRPIKDLNKNGVLIL